MTTPQTRLSLPEVRQDAACMCEHGYSCSSFAPGHALHLIQARLASATPLGWADALVQGADPASGTVHLRTIGGDVIAIWSARGAALEATTGSPVALHRNYAVLAIGAAWYNVALKPIS